MSDRNRLQMSTDFWLYEGECHGENCCGHAVIVQPHLWALLQKLRDHLGRALSPNCIYRCPTHNARPEVGGHWNSDHLRGEAADLPCPPNLCAREFADMCLEIGFPRVGYYPEKRFVHASIHTRPGYLRLWRGGT